MSVTCRQTIDAAEIDERTVIGDVLDNAFNDLTLFEVLDDLGTLFGTALFKNGTARYNDVAAALVHLEDFEGLRVVHQRGNVADRTDVDLRARQEGYGAVEIDGETTLDLIEDHTIDAFAAVELLFETDPAFFAACFFTRQNCFAEGVFDALDVNFNDIARLERTVLGFRAEFLQRNAALDLEAGVDDRHVFFDGDDTALDDITFSKVIGGKGLGEKSFEIFARWIGFRHKYS